MAGMDEQRLQELLRSPLDDMPERSVPRQVLVGAGVVVGAALLFAAGAWFLRSGDGDGEQPAGTVAAPEAPAPATPAEPGQPAPAVTGESPGTTAPPATVPAAAGYPDVGGLTAMAYGGGSRVVMFGGGIEQAASGIVGRGFPEGQLWALELEEPRGWSQLSPELPVPAARTGATLTPFGDGTHLLLFGGSGDALFFCSPVPLCSAGLLNDTWVYDTQRATWMEVPAAGAPEPRVGHAAAYDSESGVVVVFGGAKLANATNRTGSNLGDTWAWLPETREWRAMSPPELPPARSFHAMAYDPRLDLVVMWGGDTTEGGIADREVWGYDYDADAWQRLTDGFDMAAPWYHQMAYVPEMERIVVVGGWVKVVRDLGEGVTATNVGPTDDVWALDAGEPSIERLTPTPEPTSQVGMAVVPGQGVAVYGGAHTYLYQPFEDKWLDLTEDLGGF